MTRHSNNIARLILASALLLLTLTANAQFKKPLASQRILKSKDATVNIGLVAGPSFTYWYHQQNPNAGNWHLKDYQPQFKLGYFGGIAGEYLFTSSFAVGLNAIYAQHNVSQIFVNDRYPYQWDATQQSIVFSQRTYSFQASYQSVELFIPITYYHNLRLNKKVKPYVYVGPRASYILDGDMIYKKTDLLPKATQPIVSQGPDTVAFADTLRFNLGVTAGLGVQFKIETDSYYFLLKFDVSANFNLRQTFSKADLLNEFNYKRYYSDAMATVTFMLPWKKRLRDACYYFRK